MRAIVEQRNAVCGRGARTGAARGGSGRNVWGLAVQSHLYNSYHVIQRRRGGRRRLQGCSGVCVPQLRLFVYVVVSVVCSLTLCMDRSLSGGVHVFGRLGRLLFRSA